MSAALRMPGGRDALMLLLRYLLRVTRSVEPATLRERVFPALEPDVKQNAMTLEEMLKQEGRQQGRRQLLLLQIGKRFGALPAEVVQRIETAGEADLDRLALRLLDARSLLELLSE